MDRMFSRRVVVYAAAALMLVAGAAHAQDYPSRPILILCGQPAGSGPDTMIRLYADVIGRNVGQRAVVCTTVTAVIPTYRRPELLQRAIRSVLAQTHRDVRVHVYDNASGDATEDVVRAIAASDARVTYHAQPSNIGATRNFQYGMRDVKTPYFSCLSDDDVLFPDFYATALAAMIVLAIAARS